MKNKENENFTSTENNNKQITSITIAILFVLIIFAASMIIFANIITDLTESSHYIEKEINDSRFDTIMEIHESLEKELYSKLKDISNSMEKEIKSKVDMDEFEKSIENNYIPEDVEKIIKKYIEDANLTGIDNDDNDIFICTYTDIIADYSKTTATNETQERTWENEIKDHENQGLAKSTIKGIIDQNSKTMLVFEKYKSDIESHDYYRLVTQQALRNIYTKEGIEGLKGYTFLIPVYITDTGDIFGKEDIVDGHKQNNHKFIVVQEYSLYDYITTNYPSLIETSLGESTQKQFLHIQSYMYILAISLITAIICTILFLSVLSNRLFDLLNLGNKNNKSNSPFGRRSYDFKPEEVIEILSRERKARNEELKNLVDEEKQNEM